MRVDASLRIVTEERTTGAEIWVTGLQRKGERERRKRAINPKHRHNVVVTTNVLTFSAEYRSI